MTLLLWARFLIIPLLLAVAVWLVWAALTDSANDERAATLPWRAFKR